MLKLFISVCICCTSFSAFAQTEPAIDTTAIIDSLLQDLADFQSMDSINNQSYFDVNMSIGSGYFFTNANTTSTATDGNKIYYTFNTGYYHKSGFSLSGTMQLVPDTKGLALYQYSITPAYDYTTNKKLGWGISYTRYINSKSSSYAASPIDNEIYGYATLKKNWFNPTIGIDYGFGKSSEIQYVKRKLPNGTIITIPLQVNTKAQDFSLMLSANHEFNWYEVFTKEDGFTFNPTIMLNCGTSSYGLNFQGVNGAGVNLARAQNRQTTSETTKFQVQSVSILLNASYEIGKFYFQPQIYFDYSFIYPDEPFNSIFGFTVGASF
jgi:hypothetical protein